MELYLERINHDDSIEQDCGKAQSKRAGRMNELFDRV